MVQSPTEAAAKTSLEGDFLEALLRKLAGQFPEDIAAGQLDDIPRIRFEIQLVVQRAGQDVSLCDIGSGVGLFPAACAKLGMRVTMMDDFEHPYGEGEPPEGASDAPDAVNYQVAPKALDLHRALGIRVAQQDPLTEGFGFPSRSLDVVTSFDSMEHWHQSPKRLFAQVMGALVPGGLFILGVPNCVNLRKRITVPLGRGKWSQMAHWYEPEKFRGHVREPDVDDLHYIARDMGLVDLEILGRNWAGLIGRSGAMRRATALVDPLLRLRPSLCTDLYLIGRKPH